IGLILSGSCYPAKPHHQANTDRRGSKRQLPTQSSYSHKGVPTVCSSAGADAQALAAILPLTTQNGHPMRIHLRSGPFLVSCAAWADDQASNICPRISAL